MRLIQTSHVVLLWTCKSLTLKEQPKPAGTQLPVVCRDDFLQVMEVAMRCLIIVCFFRERMVIEAASRQPTTAPRLRAY